MSLGDLWSVMPVAHLSLEPITGRHACVCALVWIYIYIYMVRAIKKGTLAEP